MAGAYVTYLVGDRQARWDTGNVTFEGVSIANKVFTGVDGDYWGTLTFDVTGLVTELEVTTTISKNDPENPDSPGCHALLSCNASPGRFPIPAAAHPWPPRFLRDRAS
jgi:hypothetical protein